MMEQDTQAGVKTSGAGNFLPIRTFSTADARRKYMEKAQYVARPRSETLACVKRFRVMHEKEGGNMPIQQSLGCMKEWFSLQISKQTRGLQVYNKTGRLCVNYNQKFMNNFKYQFDSLCVFPNFSGHFDKTK